MVETVGLTDTLAALHALVDNLQTVNLTSCSDEALLADWRELERLTRRLPTVEHRLVLEAQTRGLPASVGARDVARLLSGTLRVDPREAGARVRAAEAAGARRALTGEPLAPAYPAVAAAQAGGGISPRHARVIVDTIEALPDAVRAEHAQSVETDLVGHAATFNPLVLGRLAQRIAAHLDPDGIYEDLDYRQRSRGITLTRRQDGSGRMVCELTAEATERVEVTFDALAAPRPALDAIKDPRTAGQRRHDALLDALTILHTHNQLPTAGGVAATIVITMTTEQYRTGQGLATTGHGTLIPASEAIRWAGGDLKLLAVVIDKLQGVTHYSDSHRLFTEHQRLILNARDGGCTFPHCTAPPGWTQVHHLRDYTNHPHTSVHDGVLVCGHDHRERIREGWTATLINGRAAWTPPPWIDPNQKPQYNNTHRPMP
jgi:hypothetical protein